MAKNQIGICADVFQRKEQYEIQKTFTYCQI